MFEHFVSPLVQIVGLLGENSVFTGKFDLHTHIWGTECYRLSSLRLRATLVIYFCSSKAEGISRFLPFVLKSNIRLEIKGCIEKLLQGIRKIK